MPCCFNRGSRDKPRNKDKNGRRYVMAVPPLMHGKSHADAGDQ
jgi:hypothetical protein